MEIIEYTELSTSELIKKQMKIAGVKRFDAWSDDIYNIILQGYRDNILHNPRLVMYKLLGTSPNGLLVEKSSKTAEQIGAIIAVMKYQGRIDNDWTIDTTRSITNYGCHQTPQNSLNWLSSIYYLDAWEHQPINILLMCEAAGYLGVVKNIADRYRIPYMPAKGQMSIQLKIELAEMFDKHTKILYFGDYDKTGMEIPKIIARDIASINPDADFEMIRMFVNEDDIEEYDLEVDAKGQVQMEQFPTGVAIEETCEYIDELIDDEEWDKTMSYQERDRNIIKEKVA